MLKKFYKDFAEMNLPLDEANRAAKRYASLRTEEVRAAFAKWMRPEAFVQVVRGPAPQ
jgi:zinc protease